MIAVCGEALVDIVRLPDGTLRPAPGGGPYNSARAAARLGLPTSFLGHLSTDGFGKALAALLTDDGVDLSLSSFGTEPTTLALAEVDGAGVASYEFVIDGTSAPNLTPAMLPLRLGPEIRALHIGALGLVMEPIATTLTDLALQEAGRRMIMVDPNIRPAEVRNEDVYRRRLGSLMERCTIVKASDADLAWLFPGLDPVNAARQVLQRGPQVVVVTLGALGAIGVIAGVEVHVSSPDVEVVDTIGAGDAFGAALLAWLAEHGELSAAPNLDADSLDAALRFASRVAAMTCTRAGADPPRRRELT